MKKNAYRLYCAETIEYPIEVVYDFTGRFPNKQSGSKHNRLCMKEVLEIQGDGKNAIAVINAATCRATRF